MAKIAAKAAAANKPAGGPNPAAAAATDAAGSAPPDPAAAPAKAKLDPKDFIFLKKTGEKLVKAPAGPATRCSPRYRMASSWGGIEFRGRGINMRWMIWRHVG